LKKFHEKKSYVLVQRSWRNHFINQPAPSTNNIKEIVRRFEETCSLDPRPRRKKTPAPKVQEAKSNIKEVICQKPNTSNTICQSRPAKQFRAVSLQNSYLSEAFSKLLQKKVGFC